MNTGGARLALSWLTVLPVRGPAHIDRATARTAIALAPLTGLALGLAAAGLLWLTTWLGIAPALAGALTVAALALWSRGMHLDGLADTFDGLGCYGPPERARQIMRDGGAGPFGVAAIVFCVGLQSLSFGILAARELWWTVPAVIMASRAAAVLACRTGTSTAPDAGFGALVAGTQPRWLVTGWAVAAVALAAAAVPRTWWLGIISVAAALLVSAVLARHCARRFGGLSGDVLGAVIELTATTSAVLLTVR